MGNADSESEISETEVKVSRNKEMKVLVMGMGRTGTTALASGLQQMGFTPYDYIDRFRLAHLHLWDEAMRAKFHGRGKPWTREDFDRVTGDFDCILDVPCCFFAEDLCRAYPNAKVILNTRDPEDWLRSMQRTLFTVFQWRSWRILRYTDPYGCGTWCRHNEVIWNHFCDGEYANGEKCKKRFLKHYEHVRRVVPADRLLEYDIKEGWTPVTDFLGLPEFRGVAQRNDAAEFLAHHEKGWWSVLRRSVKNLTKFAGVGAVVFGVILAGRRVS